MTTWRLNRGRTGTAVAYVRGSKAEAVAAAHRLADRLGAPVSVIHNPAGFPVKGEVWTRKGGGRSRVREADGQRVEFTDLSSGNRVWLDTDDFLETHRPPGRVNPNRKGRKRALSPTRHSAGPGTSSKSPRGRARSRSKPNPKGRKLSVPEQHQLKIARQTLRLRPEFARIMGGPTVEEAREIIYRLTGAWPKDNPRDRLEPTRIRQRGTRVTAPLTPEERISAIRSIVERSQYAKVDGTMIDLFSASAIVSVYDALNEANRLKFASFPAGKMGIIAFKLLKQNPRGGAFAFRQGWRRAWAACLSGRGAARQNPPRAPRRVRRAAASGRFVKARHHAQATVARGVRRLDTQRRGAFGVGRSPNPKGRKGGFTRQPATIARIAEKYYELRSPGIEPIGSGTKAPLVAWARTHGFAPTFVDERKPELRAQPWTNPKGRKYGAAPRSKGRIERKIVPQDYWIEPSSPEELAADPGSPYRMVTTGGQRFALSTNDAIRAQKEGLEFRPRPNRRRKGLVAPRRKVRGTARRNPRESGLVAARRTFRRLNQNEPGRVTRVHGAKGAPKVAVRVGELVSFKYRSDKYAGTPDNPHGKVQLYEHTTRRPRPVLATDSGGKEVHIVGGRMHWTPDGAVN